MSEMHTNTTADTDKYILNGVEVTPNEFIDIVTNFLEAQQSRLRRRDARIAELELGLNNQTVHSNTLQKILTERLDRIAEVEAAQRWIRTKVKLPDRAVRQFYEVVCLHQDFAELALFSKGRWIIYEGTSVYDITDRVVFWRRRQPLPAEVMDVLNKRQELQ